jgi:hypothetical protein
MKKYFLSLFLILILTVPVFAQLNPAPSIIPSADCSWLTFYGCLCQDTGDGKIYKWDGETQMELPAGGAGSGDVVGPDGDVSDGDVVGFDGTTGKIVKKITSISDVTLGGFTASQGVQADVSGNLVSSGAIPGAVTQIGTFAAPITDTPYSLTNGYNVVLWYGATGEIDLPASVAGMNVIVYNTGSFTITIDPDGSDVIVRDGTAQSGGVSFTLSSGAGNYVTLVSDAANHWVTVGYKGSLGEGT